MWTKQFGEEWKKWRRNTHKVDKGRNVNRGGGEKKKGVSFKCQEDSAAGKSRGQGCQFFGKLKFLTQPK